MSRIEVASFAQLSRRGSIHEAFCQELRAGLWIVFTKKRRLHTAFGHL
jgi:hypothetical protein